MCSNTGHSACGFENGSNIWSSGLKKQLNKRPRVPKRGPGVTELEKILREQESIGISDRRNNVEGFIPHHHSNNIPSQVPSAPKFDHLGPTTPPSMTSIYGNFGAHNTLLPRNSGSGLVLPEQELFPMSLTPSKSISISNLNERFDVNQTDSSNSPSRNLPFPAMIHDKTNQYSLPFMKQFLGPGNPTSSGSLHNYVEPPSSQSSHHNSTSMLHEEHNKMGSMKPLHPSSMENSLIQPSNFQGSPMFCHFKRPHLSTTNESQGANFQGEHSNGNVLPYHVTQDRMEDSLQHSESRSDHRPFFNFLDVKDERVKRALGPNNVGHEASGGIDLSLKL
ncbi:hypothetical protein Lal_00038815 [Lupinus albus]|uniref:Uncharacterized protein n=1 Tax=Lupinus albus TaxID=3870 RepID=A0A6A5N4B6_LUPAL|nr:hypothetical protein Lalb_Chr20g0121361 [Lupinus albus]KAF1882171.1 hypothetical protein Lal_00038815 [Lupinus albus]